MVLILICAGIALWALYMALTFYRSTDWNEPAESSPDFGDMQKREGQLRHVQEVLQEACDQGKLSQTLIDEYNRFADQEIAAMKDIEKAWNNRKKSIETS